MSSLPMTSTALFVDDEQNVLDGLRRMLRPLARDWKFRFACGGNDALAMLAESPADIIVSDMRMPGMDGVTLLRQIRLRYPDTARLVLSGHADKDDILHSVGPIHQFLSKPCDSTTLISAMTRIAHLRRVLGNPEVRSIVASLESLPVAPQTHKRLLVELENPQATAARIGAIIAEDVALTAKILQLVNSAFFGTARSICSPTEAVTRLGVTMIRTLVTAMRVFDPFLAVEIPGFSLGQLWRRAIETSDSALASAKSLGLEPKVCASASLAGILHEVGRLAIAAQNPAAYSRMLHENPNDGCLIEAEAAAFGATQGEIGGYLLGLWGFSEEVVNAITFQSKPGKSSVQAPSVLTALHLALSSPMAAGRWGVRRDEVYTASFATMGARSTA